MSKLFTAAEVAKHNTESDCWIIVNGNVFDVTAFLKSHPGGKRVLLNVAGKDASKQFESFHGPQVLPQYAHLKIGSVTATAQSAAVVPGAPPRDAAVGISKKPVVSKSAFSGFGSDIPFAEPYWYSGRLAVPAYYKASHIEFRALMRKFVDSELLPNVADWDEAAAFPPDLARRAYKAGVFGAMWPAEYGGTPPTACDAFHDMIYHDELARCASGGVLASCFFTATIALPPILIAGSAAMKDEVARKVISGEAAISLAITEPDAGSDVAHLKTTAVRDGNFYIVNGHKKFITGAEHATWFTTAVRTGTEAAAAGGVSLLLIPRDLEGVSTRRIRTQGWFASSTAFVDFDNVRVPVSNLIGEENAGFMLIMQNFNHERWTGACLTNRYARVCLEECIRYARQRKTFGKRLLDHQVINHKIAEMARHVESAYLMNEHIAFQMTNGASQHDIGTLCALTKVQNSTCLEFCAREATQIFGGNSYLRGGPGEKVERLNREVVVASVGAGSTEIMRNLIVKQAKL